MKCDRINSSVPIVEIQAPQLPELAGAKAFMMNGCRIIVNDEADGWHLSISRRDRDPTWGEIATARYRLLPHVAEMKMILPPLDEYLNLHPHTFHLFEETRSMIAILR
jgi:hypothetical protein